MESIDRKPEIRIEDQVIAKELFISDRIDLRTEVTKDEINLITKLRFLDKRLGLENVDLLLDSFLNLRVSLDRKSRGEFIRALTPNSAGEPPKSGWRRLFGKN